MVASNYHTQRATDFYASIRKDAVRSAPFKEAVRKVIEEMGKQFDEEEVGAILAAGLVSSLAPSMENAPPIAQEMLAHVFMHEIDWSHVARQFVTDESLN